MNFQKLPPVPTSKVLLNAAFGRAREKATQKNLKGNWLQIVRQKEAIKLDVVKDNLCSALERILTSFPQFEELPSFYLRLVKTTRDYPLLRQSLGAVLWSVKRIGMLQRFGVQRIAKTTDQAEIKHIVKETYGRISSILKQIDKNLQYLEQSRVIMKTYPDIKEMFTICIYGFPNVGKTTLLNKLTSAKAVIAPYAFTTKTINVGYFTLDGHKIQVLDVPGTLARENKLNPIEQQAELALEELANLIIYVFDATEQSGYPLEKQEQLYQKVSKTKKTLVFYSKTDLYDEKVRSLIKHKYYHLEELKNEIINKVLESANEALINPAP